MAGSLPLALTQHFDASTRFPMAGGLLSFYVTGSLTPQQSYSDTGLTVLNPWPLVLDANGRVPNFYLADGTVRAKLTDVNGDVSKGFFLDNLLVIGPSTSGITLPPAVDPNAIQKTGQLLCFYGVESIPGLVRANARTIGNAASGATERANADTEGLFSYLYAAAGDSVLAVSGGRGASAAADYAANKMIALPDWRGRDLRGFDDMGNTAAARLTTAIFTGIAPTLIGAVAGVEKYILLAAELAANIPNSVTAPAFNSNIEGLTMQRNVDLITVDPGGFAGGLNVPQLTNIIVNQANSAPTATINPSGGAAHTNMPPTQLCTIYIKL